MQRLSRTELATFAGVSKAAAGKAFTGRLKPAVIGHGRKAVVDIDHPVCIDYIDEKRLQARDGTLYNYQQGALGNPTTKPRAVEYNEPLQASTVPVQQTVPQPVAKPVQQDQPQQSRPSIPNRLTNDDIQDLENLTVREITLNYGSAPEFKSYVSALKDIADYKNKELLMRQRRGDLIERASIGESLFSIVNIAFTRLVTDIPVGLAQQLIAVVKSGGDDMEIKLVEMLRESIGRVLKDAKKEVKNRLRQSEI